MNIPIRLFPLLALLSLCAGLQAQGLVSGSMNYEGSLVDNVGDPLPDGNYDIAFNIYSQASGGTPVWGPQEFDGDPGTGHKPLVSVVAGRFNVLIGPTDTSDRLLSEAFNGAATNTGSRFIEVVVQGTALSPRQQILASPYALTALGMIPVGSIIAHHIDLGSAADLAMITSSGFALCDGSTAASQGVANPIVTDPLPDLLVGNGTGRFLRGTTGTTGVNQDDQMQGHFHSLPVHNHTASSPPHTHTVSEDPHIHEFTTGEGDAGDRDLVADGDSAGGTHSANTDSSISVISVDQASVTINNTNSASPDMSGPTVGSHGVPRVGDETRPDSMTVVWIMRVR